MTSFSKTCLFILTAGVMAGPWAVARADDADVAEVTGEAAAEAVEATEELVEQVEEASVEAAEAAAAAVEDGFASDLERLSYAIGMNIGTGMRNDSLEIDPDTLIDGIRASYTEGETRMTMDQAMAFLQSYSQKLQQEQMEAAMKEQQEALAANNAAAEAFFAENKDAEGVSTTDSGLQYIISEKGDGPLPGPSDSVTVHYKGSLLDGEVFDSSYDRGEPATFPINGVIPGFGEGLQLMPVGSKGKLFIPGDIAYGMQGGPGGPNATLVFDVEIIATQPPAAPAELPALGD